jgi:nucleotide-binding universal stress UspA family protein
MFTTIVVGFDGREGGRNALLLAHSLQERAGGTLVAVHVYPYEPFQVWGLRPEVERLVRDQTDALVRAQVREAGVDAQLLVTPDTSPARGVHRIAGELDADLLIVGASHRGAVGRVLARDNVRAMLQGAERPVVITPRQAGKAPLGEPVIGVGYDGSLESRAALGWAASLAEAVDGTVRVLSAAEPPQGFSPSISYGINWVGLAPERKDYTERIVADAVADVGDRATGQAVVGIAAEELAQLSSEVSLLVLGSRGYGPVRRTLLGSTSDRVIHTAVCPVVVVPRGAQSEKAAEGAATRATTVR